MENDVEWITYLCNKALVKIISNGGMSRFITLYNFQSTHLLYFGYVGMYISKMAARPGYRNS